MTQVRELYDRMISALGVEDLSVPTACVKFYKQGDESLHRHLVFRDYLRAHAEEREDYGALKRKLVETGVDRKGYQSGKDDFVAALELRALAWAAQ